MSPFRSMITPIIDAYHNLKQSATEWFNPSVPIQPTAPEGTQPRRFEYQPGYNLNITPRAFEGITFDMLRAISENCDLLRLAIETCKDQAAVQEWDIAPRKRKGMKIPDMTAAAKTQAATIEKVYNLLTTPDGEHSWPEWLRMLMEDELVIDALTIEVRRNVGGEVISLDPIDGATIKPLIDVKGRRPRYPDPSYQQVLYGMPAVNLMDGLQDGQAKVDLTSHDIIYMPRNPRVHKVYGFSQTEQVVQTVNIAIRRQLYILGFFTEGNIPETAFGCPEDWGSEQIAEFQAYWESLFEGNQNIKRKGRFIPGNVKPYQIKSPELKAEIDEWLARVIMYAFSQPPTPFVNQNNRATAETIAEAAKSEGRAPQKLYIKTLINKIIWTYMGFTDIEFVWIDDEAMSPLEKAQIDQIYLTTKVIMADEVREDLGKEPLTDEQKAELNPPPPAMLTGGETDENGKPVQPGQQKPGAQQAIAKPGQVAKVDGILEYYRDHPDEIRKADGGVFVSDGILARLEDPMDLILPKGRIEKVKKKPLSHWQEERLY